MTSSVSPKASHLWSLVSRTPTICMTLSTLGKADRRCQKLFLTNAIPPPPQTFPSGTEAEQMDQSSLCLRSLVLNPQHTLVYSLIHPPHHWFTPGTKLRQPHSTPGPQSSQELPWEPRHTELLPEMGSKPGETYRPLKGSERTHTHT